MDEEQGEKVIKLDGSLGLTERVLVTIITKDDVEGEREETFLFPKVLVNFPVLNTCLQYQFIKGFKVINQDKPEA